MRHVFVKASDLIDNQGLQGVLECVASEYNLSDNTARVILPNGKECEDIIDVKKIYSSSTCDEVSDQFQFINICDKAENILRKGNRYFIVKDFEVFCESISFIRWSLDPKKRLVAFGSFQINPSDFIFYNTKEDALKLEEIKVSYQDGREEIQGGWAKKFFFDDSQLALIKKLEDVFEECHKAGIAFNYDLSYYDGIHAYRTNVEGYNVTSSEDSDVFLPTEVVVKVKADVGDMNLDSPYYPSAIKIEE